jgi:peptide/nickel transport system permease protein
VLAGASLSLRVGLGAVALALALGAPIGLIAGWRGGWVDEVAMRAVEVLYAFPALLIALLLSAVYAPGTATATAAIGLAFVPIFARIARASALASRSSAHLEAGRAVGAGGWRLATRYLLPDAAGPLVVQASSSVSLALLAEAALSYLGLGSPPDAPSWGVMLREAQGFLGLSAWPALAPGAAIVLAVLGWSLLGDGLRDLLDPRTR